MRAGFSPMRRRRLREAVSVTSQPQLVRGQDDDGEQYSDDDLRERDYSTEDRVELAKKGHAIPVRNDKGEVVGGRYPIETAKDVADAVDDFGRAGNEPDAKAHIIKRAKALGAKLPDGWQPRSEEPKPAKKAKAKKAKPKAAREAVRFVARLHEAAVTKTGGAYEATVLQEGPGNEQDRNAYSRDALRNAVAAGMFEGLQAYADHPTPTEERERPERSVRQLVGHFKEARYLDGNPAEVRAKFVPIQGPGYEWVTSLIESALAAPEGKPLIGISIDGYGTSPDKTEIGGRQYNLIREITSLGSADLVTRAGAGGMFHRRLSESLAGARASVSDSPAPITAGKLQKRVREALGQLEAGLAEENDGQVRDAFVALQEAAQARIRKPATGSTAEVEKLEVKLRKAQRRRRLAEDRVDVADRAALAGRLLREVSVPAGVREVWFDDLAARPDEQAMRELLERRQAEHREQLAELRESYGLGLVEGVPRRQPTGPPAAPHGSGLLERMGIEPWEAEV